MTVVALIVVPGPSVAAVPSIGAVPSAGPLPSTGPDPSGDTDVIWAEVDGRPLLRHTVARFRDAGIGRIVLVVHPADEIRARALGLDVTVADDRFEGVRAALCEVSDATAVLLHDPARALVPVAMIRRVLDALAAGAVAVVPVLPVVDTIRSVGADGRASAVVDRDALRILQSPCGFSVTALRHACVAATASTDEVALMVAAGFPLTTVAGHADAARVTTAADLDHARRVLAGPPAAAESPEHTHG